MLFRERSTSIIALRHAYFTESLNVNKYNEQISQSVSTHTITTVTSVLLFFYTQQLPPIPKVGKEMDLDHGLRPESTVRLSLHCHLVQ